MVRVWIQVCTTPQSLFFPLNTDIFQFSQNLAESVISSSPAWWPWLAKEAMQWCPLESWCSLAVLAFIHKSCRVIVWQIIYIKSWHTFCPQPDSGLQYKSCERVEWGFEGLILQMSNMSMYLFICRHNAASQGSPGPAFPGVPLLPLNMVFTLFGVLGE